MATRVVHCKREPFDVYIGRPSPWGNPFILKDENDRDHVVEKYELWLMEQDHLLARLPELKGKTLGCFCAPKLCHGHVLAEFAEVDGDLTEYLKRKYGEEA